MIMLRGIIQAVREATASEALTLEQEYAMQESWRQDSDKLTFIICLAKAGVEGRNSESEGQQLHESSASALHLEDETDHMIGDINLFLSLTSPLPANPLDETDNSTSPVSASSAPTTVEGEINLMIPNPSYRRHGYGQNALTTFIHYLRQHKSTILDEFLLLSSQQLYHHYDTTQTSSISIPDIDSITTTSSTTTIINPTTTTATTTKNKLTTKNATLHLIAKISQTNHASLHLFRKVGFTERSREKKKKKKRGRGRGGGAGEEEEEEGGKEQEEISQPNHFGEFELELEVDMVGVY